MGTVLWAHLPMPRFLSQMPIRKLARMRHPSLRRGQLGKALRTGTAVLMPPRRTTVRNIRKWQVSLWNVSAAATAGHGVGVPLRVTEFRCDL